MNNLIKKSVEGFRRYVSSNHFKNIENDTRIQNSTLELLGNKLLKETLKLFNELKFNEARLIIVADVVDICCIAELLALSILDYSVIVYKFDEESANMTFLYDATENTDGFSLIETGSYLILKNS